MKLGAKNIEWFVVIGLVIVTLTTFLLLAIGIEISPMQALTNNLLLLIFAGQLFIGIILLRIYDKLR